MADEQEPVHLAGGPVHLEGSLSEGDQERVRRWERENEEAHLLKGWYLVTLHHAYRVEARDDEEAQHIAWKLHDQREHPTFIGAEVTEAEPF